jgi:hypothetical protein
MERKLQVQVAFNYEKSSEYPVSPVSLLSSSTTSPTVPKRNMSFGYVTPTAQSPLSPANFLSSSPSSPTVPKRNMSFNSSPTAQYPLSPVNFLSSSPSSPSSPTVPKRNMSFGYVAPSAPHHVINLTIDTMNLDAKFSESTDYAFPSVTPRNDSDFPKQYDTKILLAPMRSANIIPLNLKDLISYDASSTSNLVAKLSDSSDSFPSVPLRKESWVPSENDLLDSKQSDPTIPLSPMRSANIIPLILKVSISSDTSSKSNMVAKRSDSTGYSFPSSPLRNESWFPSINDLLVSKQSDKTFPIAPMRSRNDSISSYSSTIRDSCSSFEEKGSPGNLHTDIPDSPYRQEIEIVQSIRKPHPFVIPSRDHITFQPPLRSSSHS